MFKSDKTPAVFHKFIASFQRRDSLSAVLVAPANLDTVPDAFAVHPTAPAPTSATARASLATHVGSFSNASANPSNVQYLCLSISLPSSVAIRSLSITIVSTGFVNHLSVALAVFRNEPGIFNN